MTDQTRRLLREARAWAVAAVAIWVVLWLIAKAVA